MDISNKISYDSAYFKRDSSEIQIKQSVLEIDGRNNFINNLNKLSVKEVTDDIRDVIEKTNEHLETFDRKLEISIHEKTKEIMVKVIDTTTDEIIRELPPEKVLDNVANLKERLGFLIDKRI